MKYIKYLLVVVLLVIVVFVLLLGFNYKKLTLISNDNRVTLDIGRYRVKNYKKRFGIC